MGQKSAGHLEAQVLGARRKISADGYPMSIGEICNLYNDGELVIQPSFQRFFRWTTLQKSRLVESLLLGIPIPSIFVAQTENGIWELVDGLQRIGTILELRGMLKDTDPLVLVGTKYLPDLEGRRWDDEDPKRSLTAAQRLDIKRSKIDVKIIKRDSSPKAKYDLFQRLNSYGSSLSAQEVRSALLIAVSKGFFEWLERLAEMEAFAATTMLSERLIEQRYDLELVLRFLVLHNRPEKKISLAKLKDFSQLLDDESIEMADRYPGDTEKLEMTFKKTFEFIYENAGEDAFRRWDKHKMKFRGPFLNTAFEVFALGIGYHISRGNEYRSDLLDAVKELWEEEQMEQGFATGKSTEYRLSKFVPLGRELMAAK
jgi:uncharacterized protein with ParB-like and HNH nuclease domain